MKKVREGKQRREKYGKGEKVQKREKVGEGDFKDLINVLIGYETCLTKISFLK